MIYENGVDKGYRDDPNWWSNPSHPDAFRIAKLDEDYPAEYFKEDHVSQEVVEAYCNCVKNYYENLTGNNLNSIVEFGAGGGWFSEYFTKSHGIEYVLPIEATWSGYQKCLQRGLTSTIRRDLRCSFNTNFIGFFNVALATEVGEHLEICFHSQFVNSLIKVSDFIWWSSAEPGAKPHLHHPSEMPLKYWINLFDFYGYGCYMLPDEVFNACQGRGRCIFFNKQTYPQLIS